MAPWWVLSFREGVALEESGADFAMSSYGGRVSLGQPSASLASALRQIAESGASVARLVATVQRGGGSAAAATLFRWLRRLTSLGFLQVAVHGEAGRLLASLTSIAPAFSLTSRGEAPARPHVLSRFAYLRRFPGGILALESPLSLARVLLHDSRAAALVHDLTGLEVKHTQYIEHREDEATAQLIGLLAAAGMLTELRDDGTTAEDANPALQTWEFHDLLFHARSREGRTDAPFGGHCLLADRLPPPPARRPMDAGPFIELERADPRRIEAAEPSFAQVMEARRSVRDYGKEPLNLSQLGCFLHRCARICSIEEIEVDTWAGPVRMELAFRPYPAGGALHELEIYAAVQTCSGLVPGLYRYDAFDHRLRTIAAPTDLVQRLLEDASRSSGIPREKVQVLFLVAARFQRVAWKYASMAYALMLKNVGVLYQTMYLTATAMGLAPCALGAGNSDLFAQAIGSDYYAETSIGEFLLGSLPDEVVT